jgi:hypothetical protein
MSRDVVRKTIEQVAEEYRFLSVRHLREFIRRHAIPVLSAGKRLTVFDDQALYALEKAMRCPSPSAAATTAVKTSISSGVSTYRAGRSSEYENALRLTGSLSHARKQPRSKPRSSATDGTANVVALDPSRRP